MRLPVESRSVFSEEGSLAQSAISPDRTVVARPRLWRVGFNGSQPTIPVRGGLSLQNGSSSLFEHEIFGRSAPACLPNDSLKRSKRDYPRGPLTPELAPGTSASLHEYTLYIASTGVMFRVMRIVAGESGTAIT